MIVCLFPSSLSFPLEIASPLVRGKRGGEQGFVTGSGRQETGCARTVRVRVIDSAAHFLQGGHST